MPPRNTHSYQQGRTAPPSPPNPLLLLIFSLIIDIIGYFSYIIPGFGELIDVVWAPISAALLYQMYGSSLIAFAGFAEEIMPGLDLFLQLLLLGI